MAVSAIRQAPYYLVFDGQSLNNVGQYPNKVRTWVNDNEGVFLPYRVVAIDGQDFDGATVDDLAASFARRTAPHARTGAVNVLMMCGGQTGCSGGDSAATLRSEAAAYADLWYAANPAGLVLITTIPPADASYYNGAAETVRNTFNAALLSTGVSSGDFHAVVDIASVLTYPTHFTDIVHWNATGAQLAADEVGPALATLLGL